MHINRSIEPGASPSRLVPASGQTGGVPSRTTGSCTTSLPVTAANSPGSQPALSIVSALLAPPTTAVLPLRSPDRNGSVPRSLGTRASSPMQAVSRRHVRRRLSIRRRRRMRTVARLRITMWLIHPRSPPRTRRIRSVPPMPVRSRNTPPSAFQLRPQAARLGWSGASWKRPSPELRFATGAGNLQGILGKQTRQLNNRNGMPPVWTCGCTERGMPDSIGQRERKSLNLRHEFADSGIAIP